MQISHVNVSGVRFDTKIDSSARDSIVEEFQQSENRMLSGDDSSYDATFIEHMMLGSTSPITFNPYIPYEILSRKLTPEEIIGKRGCIKNTSVVANWKYLGLDPNHGEVKIGPVLEMPQDAKKELLWIYNSKSIEDLNHSEFVHSEKEGSYFWEFTPFKINPENGHLNTDDMPHLLAVKKNTCIGDENKLLVKIDDDLSHDIKLKEFTSLWTSFNGYPCLITFDSEGIRVNPVNEESLKKLPPNWRTSLLANIKKWETTE